MDIKADINWIKTELDKVQDPYLVQIFKNLLQYREQKLDKEMDQMILDAESDIKMGNTISHEDLKNEILSWRK